MRKFSVLGLCCFALFFAAVSVNAQQGGFQGGGAQGGNGGGSGFTGPSANPTTVAQALNLRDDTPVIMRGRITRSLGGEKYTFTDTTGSITVDIDRRVWGNLSVGENDMVEIRGEVDREFNRSSGQTIVEIDVDSIRRL
jgi:uncharacterized protein (TIGR00156 family)